MEFTADQIQHIVQVLIILILSICVHEFGHAIVADKLGDPLPRSQGRTTLNPVVHADPIGTLLFPLVALVVTHGGSTGFGWGRPVQVSPRHFTRKLSMRTGHMLVAAAGPTMNILFAVLLSLVHLALLRAGVIDLASKLGLSLLLAVQINFLLACFNLLPAPPLDGGTVIEGLLPSRYLDGWRKIAVFGPFVIMGVLLSPQASKVVLVPAEWLFRSWLGIIGTLA
jgi:Zn-dependent protease